MKRTIFSVVIVAALTVSASAQLTTLTTTFAAGNGQSGNMFDIQATNAVSICTFDVHLNPGTWDMEVYVVTGGGTYVGNEQNAAAWTLLGTATGVVSNGVGAATPLPMSINTPIAAGATQGFYVTVTNGTAIAYTNGTTLGAVFASDANIAFLEGAGNPYPFGAPFAPRVWNGNINYTTAGACPPAPFQANSATSSIDVDGVTSNGYQAAASEVCVLGTSNLNSAATVGAPSDIAIAFSPLGAALVTTGGGQQVNINTTDPTLFNFNGPQATFAGLLNLQPHPGAFTFNIPTGTPFTGSAQQLTVDGASVDGFVLSQGSQLTITTGGSITPTQSDDGTNQIFIQGAPLCGTGIDFYGTTYTDFYQNSNGDVSFTAGSTDFSATSGEWQTQMPRIGVASDLEPNNFGTITITNNGPGLSGTGDNIVVSYANITEWGTGGLGVTSFDVVFHGAFGHEISGFTTDGTWGTSAVVGGMALGAGSTVTPNVSFEALFGTGLQAGASTDNVIDENTAGMLINTVGWSSIQFPLFDGSAYLVQ